MAWLLRLAVFAAVALAVALGLALYHQDDIGTTALEGESFGASHRQRDCVSESLARMHASSGASDTLRVLAFSKSCLQSSQRDPDFCSSVPGEVLAAAGWIRQRCAGQGANAKTCGKIYRDAARACAGSLPGAR